MKSLTLGRYVPYKSAIHKLDPRIKLFGLILLMVAVFIKFTSVEMNFIMYGVIFVVILILLLLSHINPLALFKQLKALWLMIVFLLVINVLMPGDPAYGFWDIGFMKIYFSAIYQTLYIVIRLILMVGLTMILTSTTRPLDLTYALEWYLTPLKVIRFPTHEIAMTISIALRFIPTLLDETNRIMKAQESRGVDFKNGKLGEKIRAVVSLIVPLFISAFQRSEELANAMEARGYDPGAKRTRYRVMTWKFRDTLALIFVVLFFTGVILVSVFDINFITVFASIWPVIVGWF